MFAPFVKLFYPFDMIGRFFKASGYSPHSPVRQLSCGMQGTSSPPLPVTDFAIHHGPSPAPAAGAAHAA